MNTDHQSAPVVVKSIEGGVNIAVIGPIHTNVSWLESELKKVVELNPKLVELDLSKTDFISSSGIGSLVWLRNNVVKDGGKIFITAIHKRVANVLRFSRVDAILPMAPDVVVT